MKTRLSFPALALLTAGCTTLGGNVKGEFSCRAPAGTCAPTSVIDAKAAAAEAPAAPALGTAQLNGRAVVLGSAAQPVRTGERTLTIVFPAYVDADGVLHDQATAHAVVEPPRWASTPAKPNQFSRSPAPSSLREAVAGAPAPAAEGLGFLPAQAPHPIAESVDGPSPTALQAARAGHRITWPSLVLPPIARAAPGAGASGGAGSNRVIPTSAAAPPRQAAAEKVRAGLAPVLQKPAADPEALFVPVKPQGEPR